MREKDNIIKKPRVLNKIFILFAVFKGLIHGCKRLIGGMDDTYLKGNYKGVSLSIVALDRNNELFIIAHVVVGLEITVTWSFFFYYLRDALQETLDN